MSKKSKIDQRLMKNIDIKEEEDQAIKDLKETVTRPKKPPVNTKPRRMTLD